MSSIWDEFENVSENVEKPKAPHRIFFSEVDTQIRLLEKDGLKVMSHFVKSAGTKGKPVNCCGDKCPVCASGVKPAPRWLFKALNRKTLEVGVVQFSKKMMKDIQSVRNMPHFGGDITSYDLWIHRDVSYSSEGKPVTTYQVHPVPQSQIDKLDKLTKERVFADSKALDMSFYSKTYTPEQTARYLGWAVPAKQEEFKLTDTPSKAVQQPQREAIPVATVASAVPPVVAASNTASSKDQKFDISGFLTKPEPSADDTYSVRPELAATVSKQEADNEDDDLPFEI